MRKLPNHAALKEWSNVIEALGRGEQVVLVRKGGIADADFGLEAKEFYLYPTFFHQGESEARPQVEVRHWAEVVRTWTIRDAAVLAQLAGHVVLPLETLQTRYRFRPDQALHVFGLRVWRLPKPAAVRFRDEYAGCKSWLSVDEEIDIGGSVPVLTEAELDRRLASLDAVLAVTV
jgi:hypothetical protein